MPDFGTAPVGNTVNPVGQGMQTLSEIMNVKRSQQALQTGQYQQQTAAAQAQEAQQTAGQRQSAAQFFQNYDVASHVGPDGTIDLDKALTNPQLKATGDAYPAIAKSLIDMKNAQLDAKSKLAGLNSTVRQSFYQNVGGLSADADVKSGNNQGVGKVLDALDEFGQSGGPDAQRVAAIYRPLIQNLQQSGKTDKLPEVLRNFQLQAQDAGKQTEQTYGTPTTVATPAAVIPGVQASAAAGGGFTPSSGAVPMPPQQTTNAAGQIINRSPQTGALSPAAAGGPAGPASGAPPGGINPTTAQAQTIQGAAKDAAANIEDARAIGDHAPAVRNVNDQLLQLSSGTQTGPGTQTVQKLAAAAGLPSGSRYQEINAYLDRQAALSARQMGVPNTNAGLAASQAATGTTEYTPKALQEKVKFADALNSGAMAYRQGLDKAVGTGAAPDVSKYQSFRSAWSQNFDPDVFRAEDAMRHGDKAELNSLKQRLGPNGMKTLEQKSRNLRMLENGQIPP